MRWKLGTFSVAAGSTPFPGLVLEDPRRAPLPAQSRGSATPRGAGSSATTDRALPLARLEPFLTRLNLRLSTADSLLTLLENWDTNFQSLAILCETFSSELAEAATPVDDLHIHAPIDPPRQIFCTVANFRSHIVESIVDYGVAPHTDGMDADARRAYADKVIEERLRTVPYACFKLPTTVIGPNDPLEIPRHVQRLDWELELGVVIGRTARRVSRSTAMSYVAGYVIVNDITARDMARRADLPAMGTDWLQGKNGPGFLPMGPYLVPAAFQPDPYAVRLSLTLNDRHMQDCPASDMLFDIATQIEYISQHARLLPGDVICTGTPAGCGTHYKRYLQPGDIIHGGATELGTQHTPCIAEST